MACFSNYSITADVLLHYCIAEIMGFYFSRFVWMDYYIIYFTVHSFPHFWLPHILKVQRMNYNSSSIFHGDKTQSID